jgi:hypothetical protein
VVQPRGIVNGIDFGSTGEVKKIDVVRIKERLENNCIVMLSNLGYSGSGEVLNCKSVAPALKVANEASETRVCLILVIVNVSMLFISCLVSWAVGGLFCFNAVRMKLPQHVQLHCGQTNFYVCWMVKQLMKMDTSYDS